MASSWVTQGYPPTGFLSTLIYKTYSMLQRYSIPLHRVRVQRMIFVKGRSFGEILQQRTCACISLFLYWAMVVKGERETPFFFFFFLSSLYFGVYTTTIQVPAKNLSCISWFLRNWIFGSLFFPAEHFRTSRPSPFLPIVTPWQRHPCPHSRSQLCCIHKQFFEPMGPELLQMMYNFTLCSSYLPRPILAARVFAE